MLHIPEIIVIGGYLKVMELIQGPYIEKNSDLFGTNKFTAEFTQRASSKAFMKAIIAVNKEDYILSEALKAFSTLNKGETHSAKSHIKGVVGLRRLVRNGLIEKETFICEKTKETSCFILEKRMIGNDNDSKEHDVYRLLFAATGKPILPAYILAQLRNPEFFRTSIDNNGDIACIELDVPKNLIYKMRRIKNKAKRLFRGAFRKRAVHDIIK